MERIELSLPNPRITVADLSAIREADVPKGTQGFLPLKDITIVGNRRFPTRVSAALGTRTRTSPEGLLVI